MIIDSVNSEENQGTASDSGESVVETGANPKKRGLGRGLNALFDDEESAPAQIADIPAEALSNAQQKMGVDQLRPGAGQPRRIFKDESLQELADSIAQHGVLQPLLVRLDDDGMYEIIAGERRWRAAQRAQLHEVPVVVLDLSDVQAYEVALIENLQREDLDPIDEAAGFQRLMDEYSYTQEKLAESLGKSRSYIANITRLLQLPEMVQGYLSVGDLSIGHARALITADNAQALAEEIIAKGLTVRQTEKLVSGDMPSKASKSAAGGKKAAKAPSKGPDVLALEAELTNRIGMAVSIDSADGKSGTVSINFGSLDQMDELLQRLSQNPEGGGRLHG
jgi:ParB family chromosome partitioning protein